MKLDMRHTIVEGCALDEEGYMHRRGGQEHERASREMLETAHGLFEREKERWVSPTELGRYKTERERRVSRLR